MSRLPSTITAGGSSSGASNQKGRRDRHFPGVDQHHLAGTKKQVVRGCNSEMLLKWVMDVNNVNVKKVGQGLIPFEGQRKCYNIWTLYNMMMKMPSAAAALMVPMVIVLAVIFIFFCTPLGKNVCGSMGVYTGTLTLFYVG
jgi:hypothetical protein